MSYEIEYDEIVDDIRCIVIRLSTGHWWGFCGVRRPHPLFGVNYMSKLPWSDEMLVKDALLVFGGFSFSDSGLKGFPVLDDRWFFGFDSTYCYDSSNLDKLAADPDFASWHCGNTSLSKDFMIKQCHKLAKQLKEFEEKEVKRKTQGDEKGKLKLINEIIELNKEVYYLLRELKRLEGENKCPMS